MLQTCNLKVIERDIKGYAYSYANAPFYISNICQLGYSWGGRVILGPLPRGY